MNYNLLISFTVTKLLIIGFKKKKKNVLTVSASVLDQHDNKPTFADIIRGVVLIITELFQKKLR